MSLSKVVLFLLLAVNCLAVHSTLLTSSRDAEVEALSPPHVNKRQAKEIKTLIVTTLLQEPYMMLKSNADNITGADKFEGYVKDVLDLLAQSLGFNYQMHIAPDGYYGSYNDVNKTWSGMIGEVLSGAADLAAGDLTITSARMQYVDFVPMSTVGISLLMKKPPIELVPDADAASAYFFLNGFTISVWICVLVAFVVVSIINYFVSKFTQARNHPNGIFDGVNYSFGTTFFRKDNMNTRITSLKFLSGVWWIFTFFLAVLYISSMSSNVMVQLLDLRKVVDRQNYLLKDCHDILEDSVKTGKPQIGLLGMGSTHSFFRKSKIASYARYAEILQKKPTLLLRSYAQGIQRIRDEGGNYAFLMESSSTKYISGKFCDLYSPPGTFDAKQHGFAIKQDSPNKIALHREMLRIQEVGELRKLETKWWKSSCDEREKEWLRLKALDHSPVSLSQMSGVFYFLLVGVVLSLMIFVLEMVLKRRQGNEPTFGEERQELTNCDDPKINS